jgi:tetratricopeptide (TPR) repeat protein
MPILARARRGRAARLPWILAAGGPPALLLAPLALLLALLGVPAAHALPRTRPVDDQATALLRQLKEGDAEARREAVLGLADHGDSASVPQVAAALRDTDPAVRQIAEQALWAIWGRSGNAEVDRLYRMGTALLAEGQPAQAVDVFTRIIRQDPAFAEAYNKRATAYYQIGRYEDSLNDIDEVLKRNPYHFGALSGAGLCMIELGRLPEAVAYFERALKINPNLDGIAELKRAVEKRISKAVI